MKLSTHTQVSSANDNNATEYDFIYSEVKGKDIIEQEIELITKLNPKGKTILDIGCGSGRHVIPLAELGYMVTGLDLSSKMLEVLKDKLVKNKLNNSIVLHGDILAYDFRNQKFDLLILMWNAINEIAMNEESLRLFFVQVKKLMHEKSKLVINIDNLENTNIAEMNHQLSITIDNFKYKSDWKVEKLDRENNITHSRETIAKYTLDDQLVEETSGIVIQKWWRKEEIQEIAGEFGINFKNESILGNEELYLVGILS